MRGLQPGQGEPFLVVGTAAAASTCGSRRPRARKTIDGTVMNIDATDPRYVTVRVEVDNRALNLLDHSAATVIINPGEVNESGEEVESTSEGCPSPSPDLCLLSSTLSLLPLTPGTHGPHSPT